MTDLGDPVVRIKSLQEWAVKKAAMYDRKRIEYAHQNSAEVNLQRYRLVVELCDKVLGRAE